MPNFVVLRASAGQVPSLGSVGSADVYRGTHTDATAAANAAATAGRSPPGAFLYVIDETVVTRFLTASSAAAG
jgi:hypothetical protein